MDKRDRIAIIILGVIFIFIFFIIYLNCNKNNTYNKQTEFSSLTLVEDESIFFSISDSINKISEYESNNVPLNLILENSSNASFLNTNFIQEELYVVSKNSLYKYYVRGKLYYEELRKPLKFIRDSFYIIDYDMNTGAYSIKIINENDYSKKNIDNYDFKNIELNDYNRFIFKSFNDKNRAYLYFNDMINKMFNNPEQLYLSLDSECIDNYFDTIDKFIDFRNEISNPRIIKYSVDGNKIGIIDNYNNEYIFDIFYVLKYNLLINKNKDNF